VERRLLFSGCLILTHFQAYELAAKSVLPHVGIELADMEEFTCCGSTIFPSFSEEWIYLTAYNLALAESQGFDIVTLCGSCTRTLKLASRTLADDDDLRVKVNKRLSELGLRFEGQVKISHIIEVLAERMPAIAAEVRNPLDLNVALSHPCNVVRPSELMQFDDPWQPQKMREIVKLTGATVVDYPLEYECCGSTLSLSQELQALEAAKAKLRSALEAGAERLIVSCGNCYLSLAGNQQKIRQTDPEIDLPLLFLPQLLGLAFGIPEKELGLEL